MGYVSLPKKLRSFQKNYNVIDIAVRYEIGEFLHL